MKTERQYRPVAKSILRQQTDTEATPHQEHPVLQLQRTIGNCATTALLQRKKPKKAAAPQPAQQPVDPTALLGVFGKNTDVKAEFKTLLETDDKFAKAMAATTNRAVGGYPVIDVNNVLAKNFYLGTAMRAAFANSQVNGKTPQHDNLEKKLPEVNQKTNPYTYVELYYFAGGARLVVDTVNNNVYFSDHYRTFYVLQDNAAAPAAIIATANAFKLANIAYANS
jgi:hypothetical protein